MRKLWRQARSFDRRVQLLLVNQFTVKLGFNMLMPYLAGHLTHTLGLGAAAVGLVMGVRNAGQRGLCLAGGGLADRFGYKRAIVAGCGLRTLGFALLGWAGTLPVLVAGATATGFAGALFDPGVRGYLATAAGERRAEAFALFNVAGQTGLLLGPLIGVALIPIDFGLVAAVAAGTFLLLTLLQSRALPPDTARASGHRGAGWRTVLGNRRFWAYAGVMSGAYLLSFQVYLALPLAMHRALGNEDTTGLSEMFAVSAAVVILGQSPITAWTRRRIGPTGALVAGLAVMAVAFLPLMADAEPHAVAFGPEEVGEILGIAPILAAAALLSLGMVLISPYEMDGIVTLARGRLIATHYGLYTTVSGVAVTAGSVLTGDVWDGAARAGLTWLPWAALSATGAGCALALLALHRCGRLAPPPLPDKGQRSAAALGESAMTSAGHEDLEGKARLTRR
ncbi:MAG: transporter [Streptosporangiaceae bacterium]|nr:transporter [Streptosporangiaceae bacterium]